MGRILVVEHIHPAGEAMLAAKAELVFPEPQNEEGILAVIGDCEAIEIGRAHV